MYVLNRLARTYTGLVAPSLCPELTPSDARVDVMGVIVYSIYTYIYYNITKLYNYAMC